MDHQVVTGSTSGIGKHYALELAKRGLDVVLISRSMEKLTQVATDIEELYGRRTKVIQADFTRGSEIYESIQAALQGLEVGILVNNVGMSQQEPKTFLRTPDLDKYTDDLVNCNMLSAVKMTQIVLPQMVARKKGIVINVSSTTGRRPVPMALLYGSSKAFLDFFSRALDIEYRSKGIIVQSILPMLVDTNMTSKVTSQFLKMSPEAYARKALNTVGLTNRTSGCLSHTLQYYIMSRLFPVWLQATSLGYSCYLYTAKKFF
ncbi:very-long-chain 3-oxoacyl-CoA reductase-like isoform X2 [Sceloporus undulatus]|uniref:very-long-chain 3-oxoacyl-CoA reductase-like isoform X2 n=1 Tax=Sceloporus undulatus TaxID=8520 RepID=UPI001C4CB625|nr:very-long-chain 3-oxoacyl-CoA reductase-like isoform X2 [Sceloporus undulatus]